MLCLARVFDALAKVGGEALVTADHGNAEEMYDDSLRINHIHSTPQGPYLWFILVRSNLQLNEGSLANIAPTMLDLMGVEQPADMTSPSLIVK